MANNYDRNGNGKYAMQLNVPPSWKRLLISAFRAAVIQAPRMCCAAPWKLRTRKRVDGRGTAGNVGSYRGRLSTGRARRLDRRRTGPLGDPGDEGPLAFVQRVSAYVLTPLAKGDIFDIWSYIAEDSEDAAGRVDWRFTTLTRLLPRLHARPFSARSHNPFARFWTLPRHPNYTIVYRPDTAPFKSLRSYMLKGIYGAS